MKVALGVTLDFLTVSETREGGQCMCVCDKRRDTGL